MEAAPEPKLEGRKQEAGTERRPTNTEVRQFTGWGQGV
jgi:hypothetical protein